MKYLRRVVTVALAVTGLLINMPVVSLAAFSSGSTGADGAFSPTVNVELQLPEDGVFNFTDINIPSGVTVTFKRNANNTPVVILATGDVVIDGTLSVRGVTGSSRLGAKGGSGGFDGGVGGLVLGVGMRAQGPGGGAGGTPRSSSDHHAGGGGGGGFGAAGTTGGKVYSDAPGGSGGAVYGNERNLPLIGGSGGAGGGGTKKYTGGGGGGGGGAILVATPGSIAVNGQINADGGHGANGENLYNSNYNYYSGGGGGGGSGGSIRLIADTITGEGIVYARGAPGGRGSDGTKGGFGGAGRIRLEAWDITMAKNTSPSLSRGYPFVVFPENLPSLRISSIGGVVVPETAGGRFESPDVVLPANVKNPISVIVSGANIPSGTSVKVKSIPETGNIQSATGTLSGTEASTTASVALNIAGGHVSTLICSVTFQLTAMNGSPVYVDGEEVKWVQVASAMGGESKVTYVTESGREIPVTM